MLIDRVPAQAGARDALIEERRGRMVTPLFFSCRRSSRSAVTAKAGGANVAIRRSGGDGNTAVRQNGQTAKGPGDERPPSGLARTAIGEGVSCPARWAQRKGYAVPGTPMVSGSPAWRGREEWPDRRGARRARRISCQALPMVRACWSCARRRTARSSLRSRASRRFHRCARWRGRESMSGECPRIPA